MARAILAALLVAGPSYAQDNPTTPRLSRADFSKLTAKIGP